MPSSNLVPSSSSLARPVAVSTAVHLLCCDPAPANRSVKGDVQHEKPFWPSRASGECIPSAKVVVHPQHPLCPARTPRGRRQQLYVFPGCGRSLLVTSAASCHPLDLSSRGRCDLGVVLPRAPFGICPAIMSCEVTLRLATCRPGDAVDITWSQIFACDSRSPRRAAAAGVWRRGLIIQATGQAGGRPPRRTG